MSDSTQNVNVSILPGVLELQGPSSITRTGKSITLHEVVVTDTRGGILGWSLTGSFPGAAKINTALTATAPGSAPGLNSVAYGIDPVTLAAKDDQIGPAGSTGGMYTFDIEVEFPEESLVPDHDLQPLSLS